MIFFFIRLKFLDNLLQEFNYNNDSFSLKDIIFLEITCPNAMIETSFSEKIFSNISIRNCFSSNENLITIRFSFWALLDYISFYNCTSGFLTSEKSSIFLTNSTFDNNYLNYTIEKSLITFENIYNLNITISKSLFNNFHSFSFGGVDLFF